MQNIRQLLLTSGSRMRRKLFRQTFSHEKTRLLSTMETEGVRKETTIPKGILGQPTCHTHPHLIKPDQLTAGITQAEYKIRRETLVSLLMAKVDNIYKSHIIIIPAAKKQYMSDSIPYVFRQNSDFFYLTGCLEPSAALVMLKSSELDKFKTILFVHDNDSHVELWDGPRTGCKMSTKLFTTDEARPVETLNAYITKLVSSVEYKPSIIWYNKQDPAHPELLNTIMSVAEDGAINDPKRALHYMRAVKSPAEIELMKETCVIGSQAINMAMACTKPGVSESLISAVLEYSGRRAGAEHPAFPPVVAGGPRATHIHYINNNQILNEGEMVLVDSGSQRWLYNSDISRTWPVSGKFSTHQKILYELVLSVQKRLIEILGDQRPSLDQLFDTMCRLLGTHLQSEGILPKNIDGNELLKNAYRLCPHHVSHYLGIDVHDTPLITRNIPVKTNMIVTVEPGIYIRPDDKMIPPEFRGVGIRIEDDVLITDREPYVLTSLCVKETADIEVLVGKHSI